MTNIRPLFPDGSADPSPRPRPTYAPDPEFDAFWQAYPRKSAKGDARKAWLQTKALRPPLERVLEALAWQVGQEQWVEQGGRYIPFPATWLRAERWEDEPTQPVQVTPCKWTGCVGIGVHAVGTAHYCEQHLAAVRRGETPGRR